MRELEYPGGTCQRIMDRLKQSIFALKIGKSQDYWNSYLLNYQKILIQKISVLTPLQLKRISIVLVQKKGQKSRSKSAYCFSSGGKTTKSHPIVDGLGNPVTFQLSSGNIYDGSYAIQTLSDIEINGTNILADKACKSTKIREFIEHRGATYTILPKSNAKEKWSVDWVIYKEQHLIECFFCKIKQFWRIAKRYEKLAESTLGFIYLISIFTLTK